MFNWLSTEWDALLWRAGRKYDCDWWGWWLIHPLHNLVRVYKNVTGWWDK